MSKRKDKTISVTNNVQVEVGRSVGRKPQKVFKHRLGCPEGPSQVNSTKMNHPF